MACAPAMWVKKCAGIHLKCHDGAMQSIFITLTKPRTPDRNSFYPPGGEKMVL
jgi:hypothetical protein